MTADHLYESSAISNITEEDINDKSKTDGLAKALALVQCSWLLIQLIARTAQGLAITELELSTAAFVMCAFVMYVLWWEKPFDMERRIVLTGNKPSGQPACEPTCRISEADIDGCEAFAQDISSDFTKLGDIIGTTILGGVGVLFSALHLAAWNWDFPSPLIRTLWRVFALVALITSFSTCFFGPLTTYSRKAIRVVSTLLCVTSFFLYCASRLGILVLTLYCFSSMPQDVYNQVDWMGFLPHIS